VTPRRGGHQEVALQPGVAAGRSVSLATIRNSGPTLDSSTAAQRHTAPRSARATRRRRRRSGSDRGSRLHRWAGRRGRQLEELGLEALRGIGGSSSAARTADAPATSDHASASVARTRLGIESVYTLHFGRFWLLRRCAVARPTSAAMRALDGPRRCRAERRVAPRAGPEGTAASTTRNGWPVTQVSR
jgi:hypothetical protein